MDFTLTAYKKLLLSLLQNGYQFITFEEYLSQGACSDVHSSPSGIQSSLPSSGIPTSHKSQITNHYSQITNHKSLITSHYSLITNHKSLILRHDVDLLPLNSLATAQIEHELGIKGSYYFRIVPESNQPEIIRQIRDLGHEIGYHYEDLTLEKGNVPKAYESFKKHLAYFRTLYPVQTICMHGSPASRWDSKDLWKQYDYKSLGILGEPYFDIDFNDFFYLTDTGRSWDGWKVSVRDKMPQQAEWVKKGWVFHSTRDIIQAANSGTLPYKMMITVHPQRWTNKPGLWVKEFFLQNLKNQVKKFVISRNTP